MSASKPEKLPPKRKHEDENITEDNQTQKAKFETLAKTESFTIPQCSENIQREIQLLEIEVSAELMERQDIMDLLEVFACTNNPSTTQIIKPVTDTNPIEYQHQRDIPHGWGQEKQLHAAEDPNLPNNVTVSHSNESSSAQVLRKGKRNDDKMTGDEVERPNSPQTRFCLPGTKNQTVDKNPQYKRFRPNTEDTSCIESPLAILEDVSTDYRERCNVRWTEIVAQRNDTKLSSLLAILADANKPENLSNFTRIIQKEKKLNVLYGCTFKNTIFKGTNVINEINGNYVYISDHDTMIAAFTAHPVRTILVQQRSIYEQTVDYYINQICHLCFNINTKSKKFIPKIELLRIIEYLPEFFHYLSYKTNEIKKIAATEALATNLTDELKIINSLATIFNHKSNPCRLITPKKFVLIDNFRDHVKLYLEIFHTKSEIRFFISYVTLQLAEKITV